MPDVDLDEAREMASKYRKMAKEGIDPIEARIEERVENIKAQKARIEARKKIPTFTTCAARYIRAHRQGWKNTKHAHQWINTLKTYVRPKIGSKTVDIITTEDILMILTPLWTNKTETAKRVQTRIENILDFAAALNYCDSINPARWRGHLDKLLPTPSKIKTVTHLPAMPYTEVPAFMAELRKFEISNSARALEFLILTTTRTSEALQAQWSEIDLKNLPTDRIKMSQEHRVPLSAQAIALLERQQRRRPAGNPYLFPGMRKGRPLSNMALLQEMRRMDYGVNSGRGDFVPHGFRSSFCDWASEVSNFPSDVTEMALAHAIKNKTEAAYRRGDLFEKRRQMMQAWADYLHSTDHHDSV